MNRAPRLGLYLVIGTVVAAGCSLINAPGEPSLVVTHSNGGAAAQGAAGIGGTGGVAGQGGEPGGGGSGGCPPPYNTLENCSACNKLCSPQNVLGASCATGQCNYASCLNGYLDCDNDRENGCEKNKQLDALNCGACNHQCTTDTMHHVLGPMCTAGNCDYGSCEALWADCDNHRENGCERSAATLSDCGDCDVPCAPANANGPTCATGSCDYASCQPPYQDCDSDRTNGCESDSQTDAAHCNACDHPCLAGYYCAAGACLVPVSCKEIRDLGLSTGDGNYLIDPNGGDPSDAYLAYCDMTTETGGWTECLSFTNTSAEDLDCNHRTWFHPCVDLSNQPAIGTDLLIELRDTNQNVVYSASGVRPSAWTYSNLTSPNDASNQYDRFAQHPLPVTLEDANLLTISGWDTNGLGWRGNWGNGYEIVVTKPSACNYACNIVLSVMSYEDGDGTCAARAFASMTPSHELMFDSAGGITTNGGTALLVSQAFLGEVRVSLR